MTKEAWFLMVESGEISIDAYYEYWQDNKLPEYQSLSKEEFAVKFNDFRQFFGVPILTPSGPKIVREHLLKEKIITYFNSKFEN